MKKPNKRNAKRQDEKGPNVSRESVGREALMLLAVFIKARGEERK